MNCPSCAGKGHVLFWGTDDVYGSCSECHGTGWLSFWTSVERAGLKAMGLALRTFRPMSEYPTFEDGLRAHRGIIRAYVQAVRKEKEKK